MAFEKEIEDAQTFLRNGSPPIGLAAGNKGHLERHPMKPELFLYNINGKYLQQNNQTRTFTADEIRKYAGAQRLKEKFVEDLNSGVYEKENKKPAKMVEQEPPKHAWVRGNIPGAVKADTRSEVTLANLYLQAGVSKLKLEANKGMFMTNPNNKKEYLYVVKGAPIKDENNHIRSFNKVEIGIMAVEQVLKEIHEKEQQEKEQQKEARHSMKSEITPKQESPQSQTWIPAKKSK